MKNMAADNMLRVRGRATSLHFQGLLGKFATAFCFKRMYASNLPEFVQVLDNVLIVGSFLPFPPLEDEPLIVPQLT